MHEIANLLTQVSTRHGCQSDAATARLIGVTPASFNHWKQGIRHPDAESCERIAQLLDRPTYEIIGIVGIARSKTAGERKVWQKVVAALCLPFALVLPMGSNAYASDDLYIMRTLMRRLFGLRTPAPTRHHARARARNLHD